MATAMVAASMAVVSMVAHIQAHQAHTTEALMV